MPVKARRSRGKNSLANPNHRLLPKLKKQPEILDEATKKRQLAQALVVDGELNGGWGDGGWMRVLINTPVSLGSLG